MLRTRSRLFVAVVIAGVALALVMAVMVLVAWLPGVFPQPQQDPAPAIDARTGIGKVQAPEGGVIGDGRGEVWVRVGVGAVKVTAED